SKVSAPWGAGCGSLCLIALPSVTPDKASLQVNPAGGMVPAGGRVSLRCLCQVPCARLFLYRGTGPIPVQHAEAWGQAAEFPINRAGPGDTGTYHCRYLSRFGQPRWSESSDPVRLVVGGESPTCGPLTQSSDEKTTENSPHTHWGLARTTGFLPLHVGGHAKGSVPPRHWQGSGMAPKIVAGIAARQTRLGGFWCWI
uniref:Immunoglobulin domain-containing protein n=1 Tax=Gopherus agassizii TaxID=38772 RepID=A0A452HNM3_9SAUR